MTLHGDYFDAVYAEGTDPFRLRANWYEERKYSITVASLPRPHYRRGLEPGCSVGVLTEKLSTRCETLISTDIVDSVLDTARAAVDNATVDFVKWSLTDDWSAVAGEEPFDLIVLSEVGYYLDEPDLRVAIDAATAHLEPGGTLLAVHWRHHVTDYPLTGDRVHAVIGENTELERLGGYMDEDFVLDVFINSRGDATQSVARREGLV